MTEIGLISCTKSKKDSKAKPQELYMESQLFKKVRKYAERKHNSWFVLSAKHGLLESDAEPIEPYDLTLRDFSKEEKKEWSKKVFKSLKEHGLLEDTLVIHAGKDYYEHLLPLLDENRVDYKIPPEGLAYGERLSWYKKKLET